MQDLRTAAPAALTVLSEEEGLFRDAVREFAETEVRPLVSTHGRGGAVPARPHPQVLRAGPDGDRGAGAITAAPAAAIFMAVLAIEELARVDASAAIYVDVHNTLVNNALLRWGSEEQKARYFPRLTTDLLGAFALSEPGSGSDAFALATRAEPRGRRLGAHRPEVLDHQRRRGRALHRLRQHRLRQGLQGDHRVPGRARASPGSRSARRRTSWASAPPAPPS